MRNRYDSIEPYRTKDGCEIRELMHPQVHGNCNQSFAEATIAPHAKTTLHRHCISEEIYHITSGIGVMTLADRDFTVASGDTVCIPPGTAHCVANTGDAPPLETAIRTGERSTMEGMMKEQSAGLSTTLTGMCNCPAASETSRLTAVSPVAAITSTASPI